MTLLIDSNSYFTGFVSGLVLYAVSLVIALSPIGEWVLRVQNGCHKIKRPDQLNKIEPIFKKVYSLAKEADPNLPDDIQIYLCDDDSLNAFATGRKTICCTTGLLSASEEFIEATLSHEFGHLSHHDTDMILLVVVGNFIVTAIVTFFKFIAWLIGMIFSIIGLVAGETVASIGSGIASLVTLLFVNGIMFIWTKLGEWLVLNSVRKNEYEADAFAKDLGFGKSLCMLLESVSGGEPKKGLFASLADSHPATNDRIARLQESGVDYNKEF